MSAEVVKKRGRPKKIVSESIAAESLEPVVKGTRQKSTAASVTSSTTTSNKSAEALKASTKDASIASATALKKAGRIKAPTVVTKTTPPSSQAAPPEAPLENLIPPKPSTKSSLPHITPTSSKILHQVRALSSKAPSETKPSTTSPKPTKATSTTGPAPSAPSYRPSQTSPAKPTPPKADQTLPASSQPAPQPAAAAATPQARPSIPLKALNSTIVSQLSARSGARPAGSNALPPNYKPVARKVTLAMVALPVVIVTSWVLYNRLVLGEDQKELVRPGLTKVEHDGLAVVVDERHSSPVEKSA